MEILKPFDVQTFNQLPCLRDSNARFEANNGTKVLVTALQDLFAEYPRMAEAFGVILLHRHFALKDDEVLVDVNGSSTAWKLPPALPSGPNSVFEKYGGLIRPRSWLVSGGKLTPYEFFFDNSAEKNKQRFEADGPHFEPNFVEKFDSILAAHNLNGILGLCLLAKSPENLVEVTEGYANVTFPNNGDPEITSSLILTSWTYGIKKSTGGEDGSKPPLAQWTCWPGIGCIMSGGEHIKVARHSET